MTIFNWVQQKLHKNVIKGDVTNNEKKKKKRSEGISEIEKNTKAILDHVGLVDALDNWFDGVLTIGTFGFDTLKFQEEDQRDDYYDDDDDECDGVDLDYVVIDGSIIKNVDQELDPLISNQNKSYDHHHDLEVLDLDHFDSMITLERPMVMAKVEDEIEPEKKRTTLAELFMIDHNGEDATWREKKKPKMNPNLDDVGGQEVNNYKQNGSKSTSNKFLFGKKKKKKMMATKSKDKDQEHSRPIKKVHQMIKRMLKKKKIHPHIDESKALEKEVLYKPTNY